MPDDGAAADLLEFIAASPTPFHACESAAARLDGAGFTRVDETDEWPSGGRAYLVRDGSLVAWSVPASAGATTPYCVLGAHTDSPNLRVKPQPDVSRAGAQLLAVEVYGGALLNSWLDRDLGLAGRVALRDGSLALFRVDEPIARIPQLAIHLDREVNTKGLVLNPQSHVVPVWGLGPPTTEGFRAYVAGELGVAADDVLFWDAMLFDVDPPAVIGADRSMLSAPRLDNLCSCWAAIEALAAAADGDRPIGVVALFDHEEIGSSSNRGAASPILESTLERLSSGLGATTEQWRRALAGSVCVSIDMAHATHPNYPERHEPGHWISLDGGPVLKTNVSQRYATDARSAAAFVRACEAAGVPLQQYAHRGDLPCGSTIGPITAARLGISTVDVGAPMLSMHSARELMAAGEPARLRDALEAALRS